jgi:hypothetical protein
MYHHTFLPSTYRADHMHAPGCTLPAHETSRELQFPPLEFSGPTGAGGKQIRRIYVTATSSQNLFLTSTNLE